MTTPHVEHRFELELTVPGTPEQVWHAIATAEGVSAWMMPTDHDPAGDGSFTFHMGPEMESVAHITAFEPERRLVYEEDWAALTGNAGAPVTPLATEFLVEARSGGTCVVRIVTSAFGTGADWEHEFWEDLDGGWPAALDNLRLYLGHFAGQRAETFMVETSFGDVAPGDAMLRVLEALRGPVVGDEVDVAGTRSVVERVLPQHVMLRAVEPITGYVSVNCYGMPHGTAAHAMGFCFGPDAAGDAAEAQPRWQSWLAGVATSASGARP
jgi:uncharacterized protein YndB with AHSA1/START domain